MIGFMPIAIILSFPQTLTYHYLKLSQAKLDKKDKIITILKAIAYIPCLAVVGSINYLLPIANNEIPFIREIKQSWIHNSYPPIFNVLFRQMM